LAIVAGQERRDATELLLEHLCETAMARISRWLTTTPHEKWINLLLYMLIAKVEISIKLTLVRRSGRV
jgi:hypothetical protein